MKGGTVGYIELLETEQVGAAGPAVDRRLAAPLVKGIRIFEFSCS